MKTKFSLFLVLIFTALILGCNSTGRTTDNDNEQNHEINNGLPDKGNAFPQEEQKVEVVNEGKTPGHENPVVSEEEREPLNENEFYPDLLKVGEQIVGLTIESIEYDTLDIGSYIIKFNGELILEGEITHLSSDERTVHTHPVYFTLSTKSYSDFPRYKSADMNHAIVLAVSNGLEVLGVPGTKAIKAKFGNLSLSISPTKPVDSTINFIELLE